MISTNDKDTTKTQNYCIFALNSCLYEEFSTNMKCSIWRMNARINYHKRED